MATRFHQLLGSLVFVTSLLLITACQQGAMSTSGSSDTLATINGTPVTSKDLKNKHRMMIYNAEVEAYRSKQNVIDEIIFERLMEVEAKKAGVSVDELRKREIDDKTPMPTAAEVEGMYKQQEGYLKKRFKEMNKPMPPKAEILDAMGKDMQRRRAQERMQNYSRELRAANKVGILIKEPPSPRVDIAAGPNPSKGDEKAKVQIIEFSDFQCPYCARAVPVLKEIEKNYGDKVRVVFRDFPLSFHNTAKQQAIAAACAQDQNKFWEYHDQLFGNQNATNQAFSSGKEADLNKQLTNYAKDVGLNVGDFTACLSSKKHAKSVEDDMKAGEEAGVSSTPSFFVNGRPIAGALPFAEFKKVIDEELARN